MGWGIGVRLVIYPPFGWIGRGSGPARKAEGTVHMALGDIVDEATDKVNEKLDDLGLFPREPDGADSVQDEASKEVTGPRQGTTDHSPRSPGDAADHAAD